MTVYDSPLASLNRLDHLPDSPKKAFQPNLLSKTLSRSWVFLSQGKIVQDDTTSDEGGSLDDFHNNDAPVSPSSSFNGSNPNNDECEVATTFCSPKTKTTFKRIDSTGAISVDCQHTISDYSVLTPSFCTRKATVYRNVPKSAPCAPSMKIGSNQRLCSLKSLKPPLFQRADMRLPLAPDDEPDEHQLAKKDCEHEKDDAFLLSTVQKESKRQVQELMEQLQASERKQQQLRTKLENFHKQNEQLASQCEAHENTILALHKEKELKDAQMEVYRGILFRGY